MKNFFTILACLICASYLYSAPFTPGNIVVVRLGDGSAALSSIATIVFLDEFTTTGNLVQSIQLPIVLNGSNKRLVMSGSATSEGALSLSPNGQFVTLAGYDTIPGATGVASTTTVSRVVGFFDYTGNLNTTTTTDGYSGNNIRGAVTLDGTAFWTSGPSTGSRYVLLGQNTSVQLTTVLLNMRCINIFGGQLYISSSSGSYLGVSAIGTGLPLTTGQPVTALFTVTGNSPYGFSINPAGNVCYAADDRAIASGGGIQKWTFNGTVWSLASTITTGITAGCRGLIVDYSGANPVIFATTSYGTIVKTTDVGTPSFTTIDTCAVNTVFRGIAFAPVPPAPAPPSLISPANNSVGNLTSLSLVWHKSSTATNYRVQLSTDSLFNTLIVNDSTLTDSIRTISGLVPLTNYWWRVNAKNAGGTSGYSSVFKFRTLGVPGIISGTFVPANGATNQNTTVNFSWPKAADQTLNINSITNYWFQLTTDTVALTNLLNDSTLTDTNKTVNGLPANGTVHYWRVKAKNQIGWGSFCPWLRFTVGIVGLTSNGEIPLRYNLFNNYPNPFNPTTRINFDLPKSGFTTLRIYDILGREVTTLISGNLNAGKYGIDFEANKFSSGVYFYRLESGGFISIKKMVLIK